MRFSQRTLLILCCCWGSGLCAAENGYPRGQLLMEAQELAKPGVAKRLVVLDARPKEAYDAAHIPAARWVDHNTWKDALSDRKDAAGWSDRIGALGIAQDSRVVVYDDASAKDAARIWWILRYWGLNNVRLLNGGWKAWQAEQLPTATEPSPPPAAAEFVAKPRPKRWATKQQIMASLNSGSLQIIDVRSQDEYCGVDARDNKRAGAIPGAKHLEWSQLIDPETERFKSPAELSKLFQQAGIRLDQPAVSHCQSGGRASVMVYVMELMGAADARNYYPGWSEWGNDDDTPVATPAKAQSPQ